MRGGERGKEEWEEKEGEERRTGDIALLAPLDHVSAAVAPVGKRGGLAEPLARGVAEDADAGDEVLQDHERRGGRGEAGPLEVGPLCSSSDSTSSLLPPPPPPPPPSPPPGPSISWATELSLSVELRSSRTTPKATLTEKEEGNNRLKALFKSERRKIECSEEG